MGNIIVIVGKNNNINDSTVRSSNSATTTAITDSVSMFDWQYELQKKLQKPT